MRDLACVAASGVRGALGLMRLMMLLSYERGFQKVEGRRHLLRRFKRIMYNNDELERQLITLRESAVWSCRLDSPSFLT
jgi:hypothetical protein